jgi:hypothetical protein
MDTVHHRMNSTSEKAINVKKYVCYVETPTIFKELK